MLSQSLQLHVRVLPLHHPATHKFAHITSTISGGAVDTGKTRCKSMQQRSGLALKPIKLLLCEKYVTKYLHSNQVSIKRNAQTLYAIQTSPASPNARSQSQI